MSSRLLRAVFSGASGKAALLLSSVALLLADGTAAVRGQSALDGFDPNANGIILAAVVQPDGKVLIGGDFTTLSPNGGAAVTRNRIARLNPDGTLDTVFNPSANAEVDAIAVQADGKVLAGGVFTTIGGQARSFIARLDATNGTADSFNPNPNSDVLSIAVQADGKILAGGDFSGANSIGGQTRNFIARLDPTTGLADSFNPNANNTVYTLVVQPDGEILVGGGFTGTNSIGGQTRYHLARLDATTGLADSFAPNPNGIVHAIAVEADGKILAGGDFGGTSSIGGQTRSRMARLDPISGLADSFDPGASGPVLVIAVQPDGKVLAAGQLTTLTADGEPVLTRNHIARLETDGRPDQTLNLNLGSGNGSPSVYATAVQPDGKILIGGFFNSVLGVTRNNIARLNTDGTLDTAFVPNANNQVNDIVVQPDGQIIAGGLFTSIGGQTRNYFARLDATTGAADSLDPHANGDVTSLAVLADGSILAAGFFNGTNSIGGQTRNGIARLDATTGAADSFNPNPIGLVDCIAVQADGKILAGGLFTNIGGLARTNIARLDASSGSADSLNPDVNHEVYTLVVQADGKILVGGVFFGTRDIDGQTRDYIARLDGSSGLPDSFNPAANNEVDTLDIQADGKILVGGVFSTIGGQTRNNIARLDGTTALADSFNPNPNGDIYCSAVRADGKILVAGSFTTVGAQTRTGFARLSNDTPALQNLAVTPTAILWTCGGSYPQFTRVTFESSTDEVSYTLLGNGTAMGSNWTLTALSLPVGQNIYIRARGYHSTGNGSESITESVRNAFPAAQPLLNIQRGANMNIVLFWATNFTGFTLEANTNLNTTNWSAVSPTPVVSGTNNVVTNAVSGSTRFYRLRK